MTIRRAAFALGLLLVGLAALFAVPGNGIVETGRHQALGTVLSHAAMLMLLWGVAPRLVRALDRLQDVDGRRLGWALALVVALPVLGLGIVRLAAPRAAHQLITREWGVVEPLQAALYVTALWLCVYVRRALVEHDARTIYKGGAIAAAILALEEIDYFGVLTLVMRLAGAPDGRLGRKHIGGFHDILDAWTHYAGIALVGAGVLAVLVLAWTRLGRYRAALRQELRRPSAIPLAGAFLALLLAQVIDVDDELLAGLWRVGLLEEPLEIGGALALNAALLLRLREARREAAVNTPALGRRG